MASLGANGASGTFASANTNGNAQEHTSLPEELNGLKFGQFYITPEGAVKRNYFTTDPETGEVFLTPEDRRKSWIMAPKGTIIPRSERREDDSKTSRVADNTTKRETLNRLKLLIKMSDLVQEILELQEHYSDDKVVHFDEPPWAAKQRHLQTDYDAFVRAYGPIFKYVEVPSGQIDDDGQQSYFRMRPNLKKFRKDPNYLNLALIEKFDDTTRRSKPGVIFLDRIITARDEAIDVETPKEALGLCLSEKGYVDIAYIAGILGEPFTIEMVEEHLSNDRQIFKNPATEQWEHRDVYLSGDVREKLRLCAQKFEDGPTYQSNINALQDVMPDDLGPDEIEASLGVGWIPEGVIAQFAEEELGLSDVQISYYGSSHKWFVNGAITNADLANYEYGTEFADSLTLLKRTLAGKAPIITKRKDSRGDELDLEEEKDLAIERQRKMKERFAEWLWEDEKRSKRLLEIYNDRFNAYYVPDYDGSHLNFPGANIQIKPRDFQADAVWRSLISGNALFGHVVGSGKTFTSIWTAMKKKQLGLINKPGFVVMNHMLGEFSRAFKELYPQSNILVLHEDTFKEDGKKHTVAEKIALFIERSKQGEWDAVFMTQSNYDEITVSPTFRLQMALDNYRRFALDLREAEQKGHSDLEDHIHERMIEARRRIVRIFNIGEEPPESPAIDEDEQDQVICFGNEAERFWSEKQLDRLVDKNAADPKWQELLIESGVLAADGASSKYFEHSGVDSGVFDEGHRYKNRPVKSRVPGMAKQGAACAISFEEKLGVMRAINPNHHLTAMTATYISNTISEFYTWQWYLQPELMRKLGFEHFDAWAAMHGEVTNSIEMSPEGGTYRMMERMVRYKNVPELMQTVRLFLDIVTKDQLDIDLPDLKGGAPTIIKLERSAHLAEFFDSLQERAARIRQGGVDPSKDNMLKIVMESTLATIDPRLVGLEPSEIEKTKIDRLCDEVEKRYRAGKDKVFYTEDQPDEKTGDLQAVFSDLGVPKALDEFSVYREIKANLIKRGIPSTDIEFVHDYGRERKEELFEKCRNGDTRIVLGSTQMLGTGSNIQKRLSAVHHLDIPWRPMDVIQRNGRAERQGNQNGEYEEIYYAMKGSIDVYRLQTILRKAEFLRQILEGVLTERQLEETDELVKHFAMLMTGAADNPLIFERAELDEQLIMLQRIKKGIDREKSRARSRARDLRREIKDLKSVISAKEKAVQKMNPEMEQGEYPTTIMERDKLRYASFAGEAIRTKLRDMREQLRDADGEEVHVDFGSVYGMKMTLVGWSQNAKRQVTDDAAGKQKGPSLKPRTKTKYYYKLIIDDGNDTEIPFSNDDVKSTKDEQTLKAAYDAARQSGKPVTLSDKFQNAVKAKTKEHNEKLAERIVAPYRSMQADLQKDVERLSDLQSELSKQKAIIDKPFDHQDDFDQLEARLAHIEQLLEDGHTHDPDMLNASFPDDPSNPASGLPDLASE